MSLQPNPYESPKSTEFPPSLDDRVSGVRFGVLAMLCLMSFILYLDRICIGKAGPAIQRELGLGNTAMGCIYMAFTIAYGLFEVPTGHWGDRYGSRGVLTRIVLWWSVFTALTGAGTGLVMMIVVRFLFGAGEAGALPNVARVLAKWFPGSSRGRAQGIVLTAALVGGAVSPVIAAYLIQWFGWRWTFALLGLPGVAWACAFYWWFRDDPAEHRAVTIGERRLIASDHPAAKATEHPPLPWGRIVTSSTIWLLGLIISCSSFTTYLVFSWYPSYLEKGRGVANTDSGWMTFVVLAAGALGSLSGGWIADHIVRPSQNRRRTRSLVGATAMATAATALVASIHAASPWVSAVCMSVACFAVHSHLPTWWGVVTEIGGKHLGALFGLMNSMGVPGAAGSQIFLGVFVDKLRERGFTGRAQWDPAFYIYGAVLLCGAACWLAVNAKPIDDQNESSEVPRISGDNP